MLVRSRRYFESTLTFPIAIFAIVNRAINNFLLSPALLQIKFQLADAIHDAN